MANSEVDVTELELAEAMWELAKLIVSELRQP